MKKILTKKVIITSIVVYLIALIIYIITSFTATGCGDFICLGGEFVAFTNNIIITPVLLILGSIYIKKTGKKKKDKKTIGFIILTLLLIFISFEIRILVVEINQGIEARKATIKTNQNQKHIDETIAIDIKEKYPNANIYMYHHQSITTVELRDYSYNNQPNINDEMKTWNELKRKDSLKKYEYDIVVEYFFGEEQYNFAGLVLNNMKFYYSSLGLDLEGKRTVSKQINEYLHKNTNYTFNIDYDNTYRITVNIKKNDIDKKQEEELWKKFINDYFIKTDLVEIWVNYNDTENKKALRLDNFVWLGDYKYEK